jgi:hypothetical protein
MKRAFKGLMLSLVAALIVVVNSLPATSADIFSNPIDDSNPSTADPFTAGQNVDANITVTGLGRGPGIGPNAGSNRYNARSWSFPDFDDTDYFTWTLTPNSNFEIDFNSLSGVWRRSGTGPLQYSLKSSVDGFSSDISTGSITGSASDENFFIDLSTIQNIASSIELRFYGWGGTNAAGTFSFNDFVFDGAVSPTSTELPLTGDYNGDNIVDAADYTVWRDNEGAAISLTNETVSLGTVDIEDYDAWKSNFGTIGGSGGMAVTAVAIPEPFSGILCVAALCFVAIFTREKR